MNKGRVLSPTNTEHPQQRLPSASHKSLLSEPVGNPRYSKFVKNMSILIRLEHGKELAVSLPQNATVLNLKELLRELVQYSVKGYQLFYKGIALNEGKYLKAYGIRDGEALVFAPWHGNTLARSTFFGGFVHTPVEKNLTVTVQTPRGMVIDVDVFNSEPVRNLWEKVKKACRFELFQSHELVYHHKVLKPTQQIGELGLQSMSIINIVLRITIKLTSLKGTKWSVQVLATDPIANVKDEICDEPETIEKVAVCCDDKELNERQSFEFYRIKPQMTLYGKVRVPMDIQTSAGRISICPFEDCTVWKATMEAVIAAGINPYDRYQLMREGVALNDYIELKDADLTTNCSLELQKIGTGHVFPPGPNGVSGHLLMTSALKTLLSPIPIIATKKTTDELMREGFQRKFILDPLDLFPSLLVHTHDREYESGERLAETIRVTVNVVSHERFIVSISSAESVHSLKEMIEQKANYDVWKQKLIFSGGVLENGYPLNYYSVRDNSTLCLLVEDEHKFFLLPSERFDYTADQDFTDIHPEEPQKLIGGWPFHPPVGWKRFALKSVGMPYESDAWLGTANKEGEWPVTYHGNHSFEYLEDFIATDFYKGGVMTAGDVGDLEEVIATMPWENNIKIKLAFQSRINPFNAQKAANGRFFVSPGEKDVRPYGFLIKFIRPEEPQ